ncbi:MAG: SAM-dependent methyltransferase [Planctomycetes bacterium]|nr:SAM-dependent methyltransferase [Planctomycetota bacterium]
MSVLVEGSGTAQMIARCLVLLRASAGPAAPVSERAALLALAFLREARPPWRRALEAGLARGRLRLLEALTIPGLVGQYALRKRWLEDVARRAVAAGVRRVVVVGAGYDPLAATLAAELPHVRFVELDHPATQAPKRRALEALGLLGPVELLAVDLERTSLADALGGRADRALPTLFVAEGLLMYFPAAAVGAFFEDLGRVAGPGSQVAFSFMEPDAGGGLAYRGSTRLANAWLRWRGEPLRWGIARAALADFLHGHGLSLLETAASDELRDRYLPGAEVARGEVLALARLEGP